MTTNICVSRAKKLHPESQLGATISQKGELDMESDDLREALAAFTHELRCEWMKYTVSKIKFGSQRGLSGDGEIQMWLSNGLRHRWDRQMNSPYQELPESEKDDNREYADKLLKLFEKHVTAHLVKSYLSEPRP